MPAWTVTDPLGFEHRVLIDHTGAWGWENLYHDLPVTERYAFQQAFLSRLQAGLPPPGLRPWRIVSS